jgi:hypothetical protein
VPVVPDFPGPNRMSPPVPDAATPPKIPRLPPCEAVCPDVPPLKLISPVLVLPDDPTTNEIAPELDFAVPDVREMEPPVKPRVLATPA